MWLLEGEDPGLQGKRLWLRPGKTYLFGRTVSQAGQIAILDKTISRKHLTIKVETAENGAGQKLDGRSTITVEDLKSKSGSLLNGTQIRGQQLVLVEPTNEIKMGHCPHLFRIIWHPVVLSFSFTSKELRHNPVEKLRADLEPLDIKFITEYDFTNTTHVISKKRNTSKGLQALVNGIYVVTDDFISAVVDAAGSLDDSEAGGLEQSFDDNWPDPLQFVPPRGEEPIKRDASLFAPDPTRKKIFEGYTFVFYENKQFDALLAPITNGGGKAVIKAAVPNETEIDDFISYVKSVAGERGLGEFEGGSEGKGVVVVRFVPARGTDIEWYGEFTTNVSLRLDHRLIDQRDFLDAIVMKDASGLRKPLEVESSGQQDAEAEPAPARQRGRVGATRSQATAMDVDQPGLEPAATTEPAPAQPEASTVRPRRGRVRRAIASRFTGFDDSADDNDNDADAVMAGTPSASIPEPEPIPESQGLFVSQNSEPVPAPSVSPPPPTTRRTNGRKRPASESPPPPSPRRAPEPEVSQTESANHVMDDIAPTAAAVKRRRIARGETPIPRPASPTPVPEIPALASKAALTEVGRTVKPKKEIDILEVARQNVEKAAAQAEAEREDLALLPEGVDLTEIRKLAVVESMEVRLPAARRFDREGEEEERPERWDDRWNGRKNFKSFKKQVRGGGGGPRVGGGSFGGGGSLVVRQRPRTIVALEEVKNKGFGIGDNYWLEEGDENRDSGHHNSHDSSSRGGGKIGRAGATGTSGLSTASATVALGNESESSDDKGLPSLNALPSRARRTAAFAMTPPPAPPSRRVGQRQQVDLVEEEEEDLPRTALAKRSARLQSERAERSRNAESQSQSQGLGMRNVSAGSKRSAVAAALDPTSSPVRGGGSGTGGRGIGAGGIGGRGLKRVKSGAGGVERRFGAESEQDEDSDDELRFRFTRR